MRLLVACSSCRRQFDASGLEVGERFHCSCGHLLTVPVEKPHDSRVVRCSSCGAPRVAGAEACGYCHSDFTLHERDLHTVCPGCMTRVSDSARFCHHCALPIVADGLAGEATDLSCPACDDARLHSRRLPGHRLAVLECGSCAGLWLSREGLDVVLAEARKQAAAGNAIDADAAALPVGDAARSGRMYRACPSCGTLMLRQNFGRKSGIIVDWCSSDGMWFDRDELNGIVRWIRAGGEEKTRAARTEELREQERRARTASASGGGSLVTHSFPASSPVSFASVVVRALVDLLT